MGRPATRTLEDKREYERKWMREYRAKLRKVGKLPKLLHPEVVNRRKGAGGRRSAEMIRQGAYRVAIPGFGWKTVVKGEDNSERETAGIGA